MKKTYKELVSVFDQNWLVEFEYLHGKITVLSIDTHTDCEKWCGFKFMLEIQKACRIAAIDQLAGRMQEPEYYLS